MAPHNHRHDHGYLGGKVFAVAVAINVFLTFVEIAVGVYAGSTAIIADALHNLNDAAALVIAWWARRMAARKADRLFTFGYGRAELVAAIINLTALIVLALSLANEAIMRFFSPQEVLGGAIAIASSVAIVVDLATAALLWNLSQGNLNLKAAFLHNLSDAAFSVAVLVGGLIVMQTGLDWIDPALTLVLAALMVVPSLKLLGQSARILMLGSPSNITPDALRETLMQIEGVEEVHHLHVWQIDEDTSSVEAHLRIADTAAETMSRILAEAQKLLKDRYQITHGTYQLEPPQAKCQAQDC